MGELAQGLWESRAGRYALERELGHCGMAVVYLSRAFKHDRPVAQPAHGPGRHPRFQNLREVPA